MATTIKDRTRVSDVPDLVGTTVGKYEIVGVVGKGGMGRVYEAINTSINKRVAMKCIDTELARNEEANARFQREALAASSIDSPHIVQIFDAGMTTQGLPYIVMELLKGYDLGRRIADSGKLELAEALLITAQILKGLHHAHQAGIVHRDLKPDNVFLVRRDDEPLVVKLLDFGVSKIARPDDDVPLQTLTRQGTVVGTPFYMSPEQAQAFPDVDHRTDLYSAGAILYECLTGRAPHVGRAYEQVIVNICMHDADDVRVHDSSVPDGVANFIAKALARERDERFQSAREMLAALEECAPVSISAVNSDPHLPLALPSTLSLEAVVSQPPSGDETESSTPPRDTPRIVPAPSSQPANELADTVGVTARTLHDGNVDDEPPEELMESGINARASMAETVRSQSMPPAARRWPLALAPGIALLLGVVVWMSFQGGEDSDPVADADAEPTERVDAQATAEATAEAIADAERDAPDEQEEDEELAKKEAAGAGSASAPTLATKPARPAKPGGKTPAAPPPANVKPKPKPAPVATAPPKPAAATKTAPPVATSQEPSLQLQTQ